MSKQNYCNARKKAYELPRLAVGDVLLVGKFKNRKATITGFSSDKNNQPVALHRPTRAITRSSNRESLNTHACEATADGVLR
jgi:hypothetical protein